MPANAPPKRTGVRGVFLAPWRLRSACAGLKAAVLELLGYERTDAPHGEEPQLMRRTCSSNVQQVSRFFVVGVRGLRGFDDHHVVEFEAFDLAHVGDVYARFEAEVLIGDAA